jgi:hypothetical protein
MEEEGCGGLLVRGSISCRCMVVLVVAGVDS